MVVGFGVVSACGGDEIGPATETSAVATVSSSVATSTTTSAGDSTSTATALPRASATTATTTPTNGAQPALLVAHDKGISLWSPDGVEVILEEGPIEVAFADRRGGVVFQREGISAELDSVMPIEWIPALGEAPVVLVDEPDARQLRLKDVTLVDGRSTLIYRASRLLGGETDQIDHLVALDLDSGEELTLGIIGSFESSSVSYSIGELWTLVWSVPYGTELTCVGLLESTQLLEGANRERWIGEGALLGVVSLPYGSSCCPALEPCPGSQFAGPWVSTTVAANGSMLAMAWPSSPVGEVNESTTVVVVEPESGAELVRVDIAGPERPGSLDVEMSTVLVNHLISGDKGQIASFLVGFDGAITEVDLGGRATIWVVP